MGSRGAAAADRQGRLSSRGCSTKAGLSNKRLCRIKKAAAGSREACRQRALLALLPYSSGGGCRHDQIGSVLCWLKALAASSLDDDMWAGQQPYLASCTIEDGRDHLARPHVQHRHADRWPSLHRARQQRSGRQLRPLRAGRRRRRWVELSPALARLGNIKSGQQRIPEGGGRGKLQQVMMLRPEGAHHVTGPQLPEGILSAPHTKTMPGCLRPSAPQR